MVTERDERDGVVEEAGAQPAPVVLPAATVKRLQAIVEGARQQAQGILDAARKNMDTTVVIALEAMGVEGVPTAYNPETGVVTMSAPEPEPLPLKRGQK